MAAPPLLLIPMVILATMRPITGTTSDNVESVFLAFMRPMPGTTSDDLESAFRIAADEGIRTGPALRRVVMPYLERNQRHDSDLRRNIDNMLSRFEEGLDRLGLGPPLKFKPRSLADVSELIRGNPDWFHHALDQFEEAFYQEPIRGVQQAMLDPAPVPLELTWNDAWIGAVGEHLAQRWGLRVPEWTQEAAFMGNGVPDFRSTESIARDIAIVETPPAFRRRLLFTTAEPLTSAKFPSHMKVRMPYWA